jgi:hypothetical protein
MPMERKRLIDALDECGPALANNALIPILTHYAFTGTEVIAFNGRMAISCPWKSDFKGAVPQTLSALLKSSGAKEVDFQPEGETLVVKAASSRFKLAVLPLEDFTFEMPDFKRKSSFGVDAGRFLQSIEACLLSVGNDTSRSDYMGVTLINYGDELLMFATDRETISHGAVALKDKVGFKDRVIFPTEFCRELLRIAKGATKLNMEITENYAILEHGDVTLYTLLEELDHNPLDFIANLDQLFTAAMKKKMIEIPSKIAGILERACIVTNAAVDRTKTTIKVGDAGKTIMVSKSERGEVTDTITLEDHPLVTCLIDPKRLKDIYGTYSKFILTKDAAVMTRDQIVYMVAAAD